MASSFYFFAWSPKMKKTKGGGVAEEGELIEVVEMSVKEAKEFVKQEESNTTPSTLYGISWFLLNKV